MAEFTQDSKPYEILTGLETWFTLPRSKAIVPPLRHKMAILTWLAIFPLFLAINALLSPLLNLLPSILRTFVLTIVIVTLMTYVVMPRMTRLFSRWLYPQKRS